MAKLEQVNIVVRDMDAMADFYRRVGVDIRPGPAEWAPHHRNNAAENEMAVDLDSQEFAPVWNRGWPGGPGIVLGFRLPDRDGVDRLFQELTAAGADAQQEPYDAFWGSRFAVVTDPDGNAVALMSGPEADRRTPPPSPPFDGS
jgi:uncharacterized glyoxalase superfamily protein PhnB